jgi:transcriptional regulator with XRE-family HTH domain
VIPSAATAARSASAFRRAAPRTADEFDASTAVRRHRLAARLSQRTLAVRADVSIGAVQLAEDPDAVSSVGTLVLIAEALGIDDWRSLRD